jgi:hypothetical protein
MAAGGLAGAARFAGAGSGAAGLVRDAFGGVGADRLGADRVDADGRGGAGTGVRPRRVSWLTLFAMCRSRRLTG